MFCYDDDLRHEKSCDHAPIGSRTILRLREDKGSNTLEFVEAINSILWISIIQLALEKDLN